MFLRIVQTALLVGSMLVIVAAGGCGGVTVSSYAANWETVKVPQGTFAINAATEQKSEVEYKKLCRHVSYKDFESKGLKTDQNVHKGEDVYFRGPAFLAGSAAEWLPGDVSPNVDLTTVGLVQGRIVNSQGESAVWILWPGPLPGPIALSASSDGMKYHLDVEIWGECQGTVHDTDLPLVRARYITVHARV